MNELNGIIIINKPKGYTSHDVVAKIKKILKIKKVGHTGTLDPNATGVLPLLLNDGTKLSKYIIKHDKIYEVELKLGIKTTTADIEGKIIEEKEVNWCEISANIESILKTFEGKQTQIPPIYSAIKVNGKKLYEYAREGKNVEITPRNIEIYSIDLIKKDEYENIIKFRVSCSKGTYIRALCEDIAEKLGTVGYMKELNRTKVGIFDIKDSITIEELENDIEKIANKIIQIEEFFKDLDSIKVNNIELKKFLNGMLIDTEKKDGIYNIYSDKYVGIGIIKNHKLKRDIVI